MGEKGVEKGDKGMIEALDQVDTAMHLVMVSGSGT
jgi:hypothetical protein